MQGYLNTYKSLLPLHIQHRLFHSNHTPLRHNNISRRVHTGPNGIQRNSPHQPRTLIFYGIIGQHFRPNMDLPMLYPRMILHLTHPHFSLWCRVEIRLTAETIHPLHLHSIPQTLRHPGELQHTSHHHWWKLSRLPQSFIWGHRQEITNCLLHRLQPAPWS